MQGQITSSQAGCWLDGHHGWHNSYRVIDLAIEYGWVPDDGFPTVSRIRDAYEDQEDYILDVTDGRIDIAEAIIGQGGYADQATDYLQSIAPDGYVFEWDCGELCLVQSEGDES